MGANETQIGGDHYKKYGDLQPWSVYEKWLGTDGFIGYLRGNIFSYLIRYKDKGGVKDLKKARHDLDKLIELESAAEIPEQKPCRTFSRPLQPFVGDSIPVRCSCCDYYEVGSGNPMLYSRKGQ